MNCENAQFARTNQNGVLRVGMWWKWGQTWRKLGENQCWRLTRLLTLCVRPGQACQACQDYALSRISACWKSLILQLAAFCLWSTLRLAAISPATIHIPLRVGYCLLLSCREVHPLWHFDSTPPIFKLRQLNQINSKYSTKWLLRVKPTEEPAGYLICWLW
jgi:hypothetical protein